MLSSSSLSSRKAFRQSMPSQNVNLYMKFLKYIMGKEDTQWYVYSMGDLSVKSIAAGATDNKVLIEDIAWLTYHSKCSHLERCVTRDFRTAYLFAQHHSVSKSEEIEVSKGERILLLPVEKFWPLDESRESVLHALLWVICWLDNLYSLKQIHLFSVNTDRDLIFRYDLHKHFMQLIPKFGQYSQHSLFIK